MPNIYIETYGCALNHGDTGIMKKVLAERGHTIVEEINKADVVIINTCTVRYETEQKMIKRIKYFIAKHRDKKLVVAGCMAKAQPYLVASIAPSASLVSPQNAPHIWMAVEAPGRVLLLSDIRDNTILGYWHKGAVAEIPIQEGCLGNCSFCIVRRARRRLISYPIERIVSLVKDALRKGVVEIRLAGQDTASYGIDIYGKPALPKLLSTLKEIKGTFMIRIGMMNPDTLLPIIDELIDAINNDDRIYRFLHIPLQSGSNSVLKVMRRKYTVEDYIYIVKLLRRKIPEISIATDIIVGHPGERDEDFAATLRILEMLEPDRIHVAGYTLRPNTAAAAMEQVPTNIKKKRLAQIMKLVEEIGLRKHRTYLGKTVEVFTVERGRGITARTRNYIPVVINEHIVNVGKWIHVRINDATFFDLRGTIL